MLDSETREALGRGRWRQPPLTRPVLSLTLALVLLLHLLFGLALWYEMQPRRLPMADMSTDTGQALIVRLISNPGKPPVAQPPELPVPPPTTSPAPAARIQPVVHEKPRHDAMVVQDHVSAPAQAASVPAPSAASLFSKGGSIRLPTAAEPAPATASTDGEPPKGTDDRQIMQHDSNRMHYKATRFEKYFPPPNETAGGAVGRHVGDVIKDITKSICDPEKKSTATNLLCGAPPPPASPMDADERLNLPPAPLANNPNPPKTPPLSSCIDAYRAGKPLSSGCPIDTPDLAFKAEMRECIDLYRAGKRLKTWCPADTAKRAAAEPPMPAGASSTEMH